MTSDGEAALLAMFDPSSRRGSALDVEARARIDDLAQELESSSDTETSDSELLPGRWRVLYQGTRGVPVSPTSIDAWREYLGGDGPSPIQNLVSGSSSVDRLYQIIDGRRFLNVVDFSPAGCLAIEARLEGKPSRNRLAFRFTGGRILLRAVWNGTLDLPYPVPFDLLGENAKGWLQTDYLTSSLRLSRGNKGSLFVLVPEADDDPEALAALLSRGIPGGPPRGASADSSPSTAQEAGGQSAEAVTRAERNPVIVCPAQFGTAEDYEELVDALRSRGHPTTVVPLRRRDWFRLIPASLTAEYWRGELRPETALPFYFESLDKAADAAVAASPGRPISLVAHSIGGWVARAYLGQLSEAKRSRFGALVTLGTPHAPPPDGIFRTLDQTRGLLSNVEANYPGAYHDTIRYMTVGGRGVRGALSFSRGFDPLLAYASYLPLSGDGEAEGDGICPVDTAMLVGAEQRTLDCFHIGYVPFFGARLIGTPWYGSRGVLEQWVDFLE